MIVECTRQFLSDRTIVGEYETAKLTHVKAILENRGYKVYGILVCSELFESNSVLYRSIIDRYGGQVYFLFGEDLDEIEVNISTITSHHELVRYSRNYKLGLKR